MNGPQRLFEVVRLSDPARFRAFCDQLAAENIVFYLSDERPGSVFAPDEVAHAIMLEQLEIFENPDAHGSLRLGFLAPMLLQAPVTAVLMLLMLLAIPLTAGFERFEFGELFHLFIFSTERGNEIAAGQYWRLFTPVFLHFGIVHFAFNLLGLYVVGTRLEPLTGSVAFVLLTVVTGVVGNVAQFALGGSVFFGGMSGVLMALVGFALAWRILWPQRDPGLPAGVYVVCIGVTLLGFTGGLDGMTGGGGLANWAHLGGLLAGAAAGLIATPLYRRFNGSSSWPPSET